MKFKKLWLLAMALCITACDDKSSSSEEGDSKLETVGSTCDKSNYTVSCVGDVALDCKDNVVKAIDCSQYSDFEKSSLTCIIINKTIECDPDDEGCVSESRRTFDCYAKDKTCSREGESFTVCETSAGGVSHNKTYTCAKAADGSLYIKETTSEKCYDGYGVCNAFGECTEPKACSYDDYCKDDALYKCVKGYERIVKCSEYSTPNACAVIDGKAGCLPPDKECSKENDELITKCNASSGEVSISVCKKADNNKMYYVSSSKNNRKCLDGCNADNTACKAAECEIGDTSSVCRPEYKKAYLDIYKCVSQVGGNAFVLDQSEECQDGYCSEAGVCVDAPDCKLNEYTSHCEGNTALICTKQKIKASRCDLSTNNSSCDVVDKKADCYSEDDVCPVEGEEKVTKCNPEKSIEFYSICKKAESGSLYWDSNGNRDCANGCNADNTACAE